ncbi:lytic murein transglycosylase [Stappia indica]|uniref:Membrane-bound lytic murein transglycosylase B n=1 Tax=Stappia indica TaxID=538381 RepID=A0A285THU1_9HYPH|nr:lytic murein transglycosylase [Stappia indica]SOC21664.1 membrane-bound lytic murein transglycosylase B [Stappia indica]
MFLLQSHARGPARTARRLAGALGLALTLCLPAGAAVADAAFSRWIDGFWSTARSAGVSQATYRRAFQGMTPDEDTIRLMNRQSEFVKPIWEYLDSAVSDTRVENGRQMLQTYARELAVIESRYGVERHAVVAIWGMETNYGNFMGKHYVVRALATLAYAAPRRREFWQRELVTALQILDAGHVAPDRMEGSWAGAMGHTQFMPSSWKQYAADYDGDGRRDIWTNIPDALASTANYLKKHGWQGGKTWGYEVELPRGFDYTLADTDRSLAEWSRIGIRRPGGRDFPRPSDNAELVLPAGASGPAFLMLKNFFVIKRYNNATAYALAVGHLADRIRGGGPFVHAWQRDALPLSRPQAEELQTLLNRRGFSVGTADGQVGPATRRGIRAYQTAAGLIPDGYASVALLEHIRRGR